jgi:ammonium transporter, Amt family
MLKLKKIVPLLALGFLLYLHFHYVWSDDAAPAAPGAEAAPEAKPEPKPDPSGANTGDKSVLGDVPPIKEVDKEKPDPKDVAANHNAMSSYLLTAADNIGKNRAAINMMWTLITGFLVMFMQAGFALVETGLTRYKNVAHTMAMNFMIYGLGMLGFWICGFAIMFGAYNSEALANAGFLGGDANLLTSEFKVTLFGKEFGLFGHSGFFLAGSAYDTGIMALFLFQMVFMDTTATIPTGAMAERWKFLPFVIYGFFISMLIYPVFGNWVWGGGWLSKLGVNFALGHGHVDFAGSSVVHMVGGVTALAGAIIIGPRLGKYNRDGTVNVLPAHSVPMYMLGTFILAFGWFGFNPGSTLAGADLNIGRIATNTMLASAGGAFASMVYMWLVYKKPDPSFMCNGMLAGLVAITAPCAFVAPWAAVLIGLIAGVLVIWSCLFFERIAKVDDPVGAISVHGVNGAWGVLSLGLFADGTYGQGWNGTHWYKIGDHLQWFEKALTDADIAEKLKTLPSGTKIIETGVTGLLYGNSSQFFAECIGVLANIVWVFAAAYVCFWIVEKLIGNRVRPEVELQGLDVPEMGVLGYINEDPKTPEGHLTHAPAEPRAAVVPGDGLPRYSLVVEGLAPDKLRDIWANLCQPGKEPPSKEFLLVYPHMTTVQGNRFRFRGGDPKLVRDGLAGLLVEEANGAPVRVHVET